MDCNGHNLKGRTSQKHDLIPRCLAKFCQITCMPGVAKTRSLHHILADWVGNHGRGFTTQGQFHSLTNTLYYARGIPAVGFSHSRRGCQMQGNNRQGVAKNICAIRKVANGLHWNAPLQQGWVAYINKSRTTLAELLPDCGGNFWRNTGRVSLSQNQHVCISLMRLLPFGAVHGQQNAEKRMRKEV